MEIKGKTDIEKAVFLLREVDAYLSFYPYAQELKDMRNTIKKFTASFPDCWECGDTGYIGEPTQGIPCDCNETDKLCVI